VGAPCRPPAPRGRCRNSDQIGKLSVGRQAPGLHYDSVLCHDRMRLCPPPAGLTTSSAPDLAIGRNWIYTGSAQAQVGGAGECRPPGTIRGFAVRAQQTHGGRLTGDLRSPARHSSLGYAWFGGFPWKA